MSQFTNRLYSKFQKVQLYADKLYRQYIKTPVPRPNFNEEVVEYETVQYRDIDDEGRPFVVEMPVAHFPEYPPFEAVQNGWFSSADQYRIVAALIFARRYPNHTFGRWVREQMAEVTDEMIDRIGDGTASIDVSTKPKA